MLSQALTLATTLLALAAALCFWRLLRGPDIVDRIMALDTLSIIAIALMIRRLPYALRACMAALQQVSLALEEAAPLGRMRGWTPARSVTQWSWP